MFVYDTMPILVSRICLGLCGIHFYNKEEFNEAYDKFINKLSEFNPRQHIIENYHLNIGRKPLKL